MGVLTGLLENVLPVRDPVKAATGRGVDMVSYGVQLSSIMDDASSRAATALAAYRWSPYIREAESTIKNRLSTIEWWLEDEDGERVTDESPENLRAIRDQIETPYKPGLDEPESASPKTRAGLWGLTFRHMGCAGYGFWYLDGVETLAGTPFQTLYISPARMTPALTSGGQLMGWVLDAKSRNPVPFEKKEIVIFSLEAPDEGFLPTGLVHTALAKAELARLGDRHASQTLMSGGRRPGIYHPPAGGSIPDDVYENLKRDLRNIVEVPDSVKRSMILKGPVEFDATDSTMNEMQMLDVMAMTRDDIFGLWGVPKSQIGYDRQSTIGGTADDLDAETMWRNAAGPRMATFAEVLQTQYLDRFADLPTPITLTFKYDEPEFDDDAPLYDMAQKASVVPMRAIERRAILGLEPFGDVEMDNALWMPNNIVKVEDDARLGRDTVESIGTLIRAGFTPQGSTTALGVGAVPHTGLAPVTLQSDPDEAGPPVAAFGKASLPSVDKVQAAIDRFLREQAKRIGRRIETNAAHLVRKPKDVASWWNAKEEDAALLAVLQPFMVDAALVASAAAERKVAGKAALDSAVLTRATVRRLARRVKDINETTRDRIRDLTVDAVAEGMAPSELGRVLRGVVDPLASDTIGYALKQRLGNFGSELRAETIARTELRVAQNAAQIDSFAALGSEKLEVLDGDGDPACAARDGRIVSMDEAEDMMLAEHPNGTLTFAPVVGGDEPEPAGKAAPIAEPVPSVVNNNFTLNVPPMEMPPVTFQVMNPEQATPVVNVEAPIVNVPAPIVNVTTPDVSVNVTAPEVTVEAPVVNMDAGKASTDMQPVFVTNWPERPDYKVKRDQGGRMTGVEAVE